MKTLLLSVFCLVFAVSAFGKTACVHNDLMYGTNTCEGSSKDWSYVYNADPAAVFETCVRVRPDRFCEMQQSNFVYVLTKPDKKRICVIRYDTGGLDFCKSDPKRYAYILIEGSTDEENLD